MKIRQLFSRLIAKVRGSHKVKNARVASLTLQVLESRILPATDYWTGRVSDAWYNPANWVGGVLPAAGDSVVIGNNSSRSVSLLTANGVAPAPVVVGGDLDITPGFQGVFDLKGTGIAVNGTLTIAASASALIKNGTIAPAKGGVWQGGTLKDITFGLGTNAAGFRPVSFQWSGGDAVDSSFFFGKNSLVSIVSSGTTKRATNSLITNYGAVSYDGTTYFVGGAKGMIENYGVFTLGNADLRLVRSRGVLPLYTFNNYAVVRKADGTRSTIATNFNNYGLVNIPDGIISLEASGTHTGSFNLASGGTLYFEKSRALSSAGNLLRGTARLDGAGNYVVSGGDILTVDAGANIAVQNLSLDNAGTIQNLAKGINEISTINVKGTLTPHNLSWRGGQISGPGTLVLLPSLLGLLPPAHMLLASGDTKNLSQITIKDYGVIDWEGGDIDASQAASVIVNGVFNVRTNDSIRGDGKVPAPSITVNTGGILQNLPNPSDPDSDPPATIGIPIMNAGGKNLLNQKPMREKTSGVNYEQTGGLTSLTGSTFSTDGTYQQSGGTTLLGRGTISAGAGVLIGSGGTLSGSGLIEGTGGATTTLLLAGTLSLSISGTTPITGYDQVTADAYTVLSGTLDISLDGYTPASTDTFEILDLPAGYSGTFASVNDPVFTIGGSNYTFQLNYNLNDITLSVVPVSASGPTVTAVSPSSGSTSGGTSVAITGTYFTNATSVTFDGVAASSFTVNSSTSITAVAPPHVAATNIDVHVSNDFGTSATTSADHFTYTSGSAPSITSLSVTSGYTSGYTAVTINGSGFNGATAVSFGSQAAAYFAVLSSTQILAYSPPSSSMGTVDVTVTTPSGTSSTSSSDHFTYSAIPVPTVTSVSPTAASSGGGSVVTITGTGFTNATEVDFGAIPVDTFTINSDTSISVADPPQSGGTVDVTVVSAGGSSALSTNDRFTYVAAAAPAITSLGTSSGTTAGGMVISVNGSAFTGASAVFFGSVPALTFVVNGDGQLTAVAPPQAAGTVDVTVTTPSGTSIISSSDEFTYTSATAPSVSGLSITSGTTAGGSVTTISGSHFTGATGVSFGNVPADDFTILSDGSIVATAPAQASATVDVTVTTWSGTSSTSSSDHFTYSNASLPTVSALSLTSGSSTGGDQVVITGSNFTGATVVNFGSVTTTAFIVLSDTSILAYAPAQAAATVHVTVTTYSGTSTTYGSYTYNAVSALAITSLGTSSGSTAGGTLVEINGSGFTNAQEVNFGATSLFDFTVNSDSLITAVAPANYAGTIDVQVSTPAGTSVPVSGDRFTYSLASAPAVSSLSTISGNPSGGTPVTITGTNLLGATGVFFGGVPAEGFTVNSSTSITAIAPPHATASVDVTVATYAGTSAISFSDQFSYGSVSAPSPVSLATSSGTSAGGTLVGITGAGFTGASSISFGSVATSNFTVVSDTLIVAVAPPQAAGTVDVTVATPAGTSGTASSDHFTYSSATAPSVSGLSPATGTTTGGNTVVVLGSHFTGATAVSFGSLAASSFTVNSDTSITAVVPPAAAATVDVTVTTYAGTSSTSSADHYVYTNVSGSAPAVSAVSPNTGSTAGGQVVAISGSGFTGATAVTFGSTAATSFTILDDSDLTATAPAGTASTVHITVTTNNGTSSTSSADQFTWLSTAVPSITSLSPSSGTTAGGTSVSITGTNFTSASAVLFGGIAAASFTVNSSTSITATSPPLPTGSYGVTVTTPSGTSAASTFTVSAASAPTVSSLGTSSGTTAGGTSVAITGTNFTGAVGVYFGGVAASSFTVNSSTSITATSPPQFAGTYDITVVTYAGTSALSSNDRFAYSVGSSASISSLGTTTGSTAGATSVTINGSNFSGAIGVMFGLVPAASFTVISSSQITAISPPQAAGTLDVIVTTYGGTSAASSNDQFTYTSASAPSVSSLGTSTGTTAGGTSVAITGTNFTGATTVTFGTVPAASFTVVSSTQITAVSPPQAASTVDVTVTTFAGTSSTGSADHFTYSNASSPSVSGVSPSSGSAAGGDLITVSGSNFTGATGVSFGTMAADSFTVLSDTALLVATPAGAVGTVDITVTTYAGTSSTGSADHYTYNSVTAPSITSLSPSTGGSGGGTAVTISGSDFTGTDGVFFGGSPAASFTVVNDSTIVAVTPPLSAGIIDVTVNAQGTTSALGSGDRFTVSAASAPLVSSLGTSSGTTAGATTVTINGSGFTGAGSVLFGAVAAASFTVNSDSSITAVSPSQAAGTIDVTVGTPTGTSAVSSADHFTYSNASTPSVSGLSASGGSTAGGLGVTVTGSNFTGTTAVSFGTVAATFTVLSDGVLVATAPSQAAGLVDVTVTTPSGTSSTSSADHFTYSAASAPSVSSVTSSSGSVIGGDTVMVLGSNFTAATAVTFGSTAATDFTVLSDTALVATAPAGSAGTVDITVTTPSGTSSTGSADHYTYTSAPSAPSVSSLGTSSGGSGGGTVVIVTGTGFTGATGVSFGSYPASAFFVNSDTQLTVVSPAQAAATVDLTVTTPSGTSSTSSSDHFTYSAASAPSVSSVSSSSGPTAGGVYVTISGSNFTGASAVSFGSNAATSFTVVSDGTIFALAPAGSAGTVDVTVTTPSGTSSTGSSDHYTYVAAPTVTGISPSSGSTVGGTSVTITGTNFTGATTVYFGTTAVTSFTVASSTSITITAPAGSAGTVDITVVTAGGTSATSSSDHFTYVAPPVVSGVSPSSGSTSGGTSVSISGSHFTGATAVYFGSTAATSFTVNSDGSITAVSPAGSAGTVDITVVTAAGTSTTSSADHFTYAGVPVVTGISPSSGPHTGGTSVTISGSGFTGATSVYFGLIQVLSFTINSDGSITVTSPSTFFSGTVDITVVTALGTSATSSADLFTYT